MFNAGVVANGFMISSVNTPTITTECTDNGYF